MLRSGKALPRRDKTGVRVRFHSTSEAQNADDLILTRNGLAHCFTHLADTADHIVAAVTA